MDQGAGHAQPLDVLRSPLGADLRAGHAPHLLGVVLEEGLVQLSPKAVEQKVLQRHLRPARKVFKALLEAEDNSPVDHAGQ